MYDKTLEIILLGKLELRPGDTCNGEYAGVAPESNVDRAVGVRGCRVNMLILIYCGSKRMKIITEEDERQEGSQHRPDDGEDEEDGAVEGHRHPHDQAGGQVQERSGETHNNNIKTR